MSGPIRFNPNAGSEQTRPLEDWPAGSWLAIHVETGRRQMVSASHWDQLLEAYGSEAIHRIKGC